MEKKKINLGEVATEAGKGVATLFGKTKDALAKAADQTGDGTFDKEDVSVIAENVSTAAKNAADKAKAYVAEKSREKELHSLRPIMPEDLESIEFRMSPLIHITEMDKEHAASELCKGSIGHSSIEKGLEIIHIYHGNEALFGVTLCPDSSYDLYYKDHTDRNKYVALDAYFSYLREACVCELEKVAQDLGAKYFRVTLMAEKKTFSKKEVKAKASVKVSGNSGSAEAEHSRTASSAIKIKVEAEASFVGSKPVKPELCYLQNNLAIQRLIEARMYETSPLTRKTYTIEHSKSSGIKAKDAVKLDGALKSMGFAGNTTVTSEVQNESRHFLEFEIEF